MIAIVCAMPCEAQALFPCFEVSRTRRLAARALYEGKICGRPAALVVSGIGKVNAAVAVEAAVCRFRPALIANFGLCGGISDRVEIGGVYAVSEAVQYDFDLSELDGCPVGKLEEFDSPFLPSGYDLGKLPCPPRRLATGDRFTSSAVDLSLLKQLDADLRDMEGAALFQAAAAHALPVLSVKAVSNRVGGNAVTEYAASKESALAALSQAVPQIFEVI